MITVDIIFERFGGPAELGRAIGKSTEHATLMRRRGSIPPIYWSKLIDVAAERGLADITYEQIVKAHEETRAHKVSERQSRKAVA